jgi:ABC-type multidrug transport system fused ATPase/permease subunit
MDALERLMAGRTTLLITHRLDTLEQCDALIRLANGRMVEFVDNSSPATITRMKNLFKNKVV